eukprot:g2143.t1
MPRRSIDAAAFLVVALVVFVDTMGLHFGSPAFVPLMSSVGADAQETGYLLTIRNVAALACGLWMPLFADTKGRRPALMISCLGSCLGYLLQGLIYEPSGNAGSLNIMRAGKAVEGLFSMTLPVALAYVTDITKHDPAQMRARVTGLGAMNQLVPIVVAPIGGAVATFGLQLPALVSCGLAALAFVLCFWALQEASVINSRRREAEGKKEDGAGDDDQDQLKGAGAAAAAAASARSDAPSVWRDPQLLGLGVGFFCFAIVITAQLLAMPFLIQRAEFGLQAATPQKTREDQAKVLGLLGLPGGALQIVTMVALYPRLLARGHTESALCFAGSIVAGAMLVLTPYAEQLWHLFALGAVSGLGLGVFFGAIMSAPSPYLAKIHPTKISQGRAVYLQCLTLGLIAAPGFLGDIIVKNGPTGDGPLFSFLVAGLSCVFGGAVVAVCVARMKQRVQQGGEQLLKPSGRRAFELREEERTGAMPVDAYLADLTGAIKAQLEAKNYHIHHKGVQDLVARLIDQALPPLVEWRVDESEGRVARADAASEPLPPHALQHLRGVARLLERAGLPERVAVVEQRHALAPGSLASEDDGGAGLALAAVGLHRNISSEQDHARLARSGSLGGSIGSSGELAAAPLTSTSAV